MKKLYNFGCRNLLIEGGNDLTNSLIKNKIFNKFYLFKSSKNLEKTIKRSKAVGEPPFMLAISVHEAIQMAVASVSDYKINPRLNAPATPEEVLSSIYNTQRITQV